MRVEVLLILTILAGPAWEAVAHEQEDLGWYIKRKREKIISKHDKHPHNPSRKTQHLLVQNMFANCTKAIKMAATCLVD